MSQQQFNKETVAQADEVTKTGLNKILLL